MSEMRDNASPKRSTVSGSLDELFQSARSQAEMESAVLAQESGKLAILNKVMDPSAIPASSVDLMGRLVEAIHFNLTPTIMTITGLTAAAVVAVSFLSTPAPTLFVKSSASRATQASNSFDNAVRAGIGNPQTLAAAIAPHKYRYLIALEDVNDTRTPSVSRDSLLARVELGGIKPIEPSKEQLQKLAIVFNDNGDVVYYFHDTEDGGKVTRHIFPEKAGMKFLSVAISGKDTSGLAIPDFYPRMVTNADGQKRFFHFEDGNFVRGLRNGLPGVHDSGSHSSVVINQLEDGDDVEDVEDVPTPPTPPTVPALPQLPHQRMRRTIETDRSIDTASENIDGHQVIETTIDSTDANGNLRSINKQIFIKTPSTPAMKAHIDSLLSQMGIKRGKARKMMIRMNDESVVNDSIMASGDMQKMQKDLEMMHLDGKKSLEMARAMQINADTLLRQLGIEQGKGKSMHMNADTLLRQLGIEKGKRKRMMIRMDNESVVNDSGSLNGNLEMIQKHLEMVRAQVDSVTGTIKNMNLDSIISKAFTDIKIHQPDINKLIPVLVRNQAEGHENALILWYDAAPKVLAQLPKEEVQKYATPTTPNGALSGLSVYPNPTSKSTTIHFTLSDKRSISFAIYSLLGQKVLDGGEVTDHAAGMDEIKLDLSKLDAGVYLLIGKTDRGEQLSERIVVEK